MRLLWARFPPFECLRMSGYIERLYEVSARSDGLHFAFRWYLFVLCAGLCFVLFRFYVFAKYYFLYCSAAGLLYFLYARGLLYLLCVALFWVVFSVVFSRRRHHHVEYRFYVHCV